jgi:hypothetical protein
MENIPQIGKQVTCDFIPDAMLVYATRNQAIFNCDDELLTVRFDSTEAPVGSVGRLVVSHTQRGAQ